MARHLKNKLTNTRAFAPNDSQIQDHFTAAGIMLVPAPAPEPGTVMAGGSMLLPPRIDIVRTPRKGNK